MPLLLALEEAQWTWSVFASGDHIADATAGIRESITIACAAAGIKRPLTTRLITGPSIRTLLWIAPKLLPLDIEIYLTYHFVKVGQQTRQHIARTIELGQERGLQTATLQRLLSGVPATPGDARAVAARVLATR
jgi:2-dehydropantoate 2-reductase